MADIYNYFITAVRRVCRLIVYQILPISVLGWVILWISTRYLYLVSDTKKSGSILTWNICLPFTEKLWFEQIVHGIVLLFFTIVVIITVFIIICFTVDYFVTNYSESNDRGIASIVDPLFRHDDSHVRNSEWKKQTSQSNYWYIVRVLYKIVPVAVCIWVLLWISTRIFNLFDQTDIPYTMRICIPHPKLSCLAQILIGLFLIVFSVTFLFVIGMGIFLCLGSVKDFFVNDFFTWKKEQITQKQLEEGALNKRQN